jgi:hypothetical protein
MDPISIATLSAAVSAALTSASQQAGSDGWQALRALLKRHAPHKPNDIAVFDAPPAQADPEDVIQSLRKLAENDPQFATELAAWVQDQRITISNNQIVNTVSGNVSGNVIMGRDININGSINQ